uniref:Forkhead box protein M1 n=1 Tax=Electrophorus electricus TaxID=8005 RepID=A0A4W4HPF7_ELEEL
MRESPRRPIILKRRKLPFQSNEGDGTRTKAAPAQTGQAFPDGIRIMDHPTMPDTQVVVIPKTADLQSVISALTAKGKECGLQGPNKFILLSGSNSLEDGVDTLLKKEADCSPLNDSLTNMQWLGKMSTDVFGPEPATGKSNKENQGGSGATKGPLSERPPYSYMAMIQFAINSKKNRRMTLKEIYNWIEDHFPYFRNVAKPGWKNSIRHNLSLHDMFVRETTADGKISHWTIRPEANRCLTLEQVYKVSMGENVWHKESEKVLSLQHQKRGQLDLKKPALAGSSERKMKPLLPRTDSYLVPIQLPLAPSLFLPSSTPLQSSSSSIPSNSGCGKQVRIAPKVKASHMVTVCKSQKGSEPVCVPHSSDASRAPPPAVRQRETSSSRRKQRLVLPSREEPVLLFSHSTFIDSGMASETSTFHDTREEEEEEEPHPEPQPNSPMQGYIFKTPIKRNHPASSTPSKPPVALEPWKITPLGKGSRRVLDVSPIHTPGGPLLTPQCSENTSFSLSSTPFKELPLFSSPRELLTSSWPSPLHTSPTCSRELQVGAPAASGANRSLTEGLVLDTMNDSLSKILVDISFSCLEEEDLGMTNISWSQLIPELK